MIFKVFFNLAGSDKTEPGNFYIQLTNVECDIPTFVSTGPNVVKVDVNFSNGFSAANLKMAMTKVVKFLEGANLMLVQLGTLLKVEGFTDGDKKNGLFPLSPKVNLLKKIDKKNCFDALCEKKGEEANNLIIRYNTQEPAVTAALAAPQSKHNP